MSALDEELKEMGLDSYDRAAFKKALKDAKDEQRRRGGSIMDHFKNILRRTASWIIDKLSSFWDWLGDTLGLW